jgi:hypothetical protein
MWLGHVEKLYNWLPADNEASKYRDRETASRAYLKELREIPSLYDISKKLRADGFRWHKEALDFTSYAWVTIARKRGDCDDFMQLWYDILKYRGGKLKRIYVTSTEGKAHAMLFFYDNKDPTTLYILSNMYVRGKGKPGDEEDLLSKHYGDKTKCFVLY